MNLNDTPYVGALVTVVFVGLFCLSNWRANSGKPAALPARYSE
jgi:hypothetical protein